MEFELDNQATEPTALDPNQAGNLFAELFDDGKKPEGEALAVEAVETEPAEDAPPEMVKVDIDGYEIELPKDKADKLSAERLMQADYTRKTMATADERKTAQAESAKAIQERTTYAQNLDRLQAQVEGALQDQSKAVDWQQLLTNDPVEYLRQRHLAESRQAQLQQIGQEQHRVNAQLQAERLTAHERHLVEQQQALVAKLPEWKDEAKATADKTAIRDYLLGQGFDAAELAQVTDARSVVMARKAMLYDQMVSKASAAAKKVSTLPTKVERPGGGESQGLDKRASAFQRLSKSGRPEDAAALFAGIL
jgi:HSP90 family molecular chaperone